EAEGARGPARREAVVGEQVADGGAPLDLEEAFGHGKRLGIDLDGDQVARAPPCHVQDRLSRMATERPWAASPSASASAMAGPASAPSCSCPIPRTYVRSRKSNTETPEEKRAERAVGRTCFGPPT